MATIDDYEKWYDVNRIITLMVSDVDNYGCSHCLEILKKALKENKK